MNRYNIFWFIIDSVRTFRTGLDDRDRLDIMDELGKVSIEFTNCVTSAPSSLLSAGAIFTGLPGVFIARHFNDWKFKNNSIDSINVLVNNSGYKSFPILDSRELRERLQFLLPPLKSKDLPIGYKLSNYAWHNSEITEIFRHILENYKYEIGCYILWYDCRRDAKTSYHVKEAINKIKEVGLFDSSIIIMHSDHGYPDPRTKLNEEFFKNIGHDMVLTDDNIQVPLIIKYPNSPRNIKINDQIGLTDIIPTIFDILNLPYKQLNTKYQGKSIVPIIYGKENEDRTVRTDTRLSMDIGKITSYRNKHFKYIISHDDKREFLYNMIEDENEIHDISNLDSSSQILKNFRELILSYDDELFRFHSKDLENNFLSYIGKYIKKNDNSSKILLITVADSKLINIFHQLIEKYFKNIYLKVCSNISFEEEKNTDKIKYIKIQSINVESIKYTNIEEEFNLVIYLTHNSRRVFLKDNIIKALKTISAKKYLLLNYNFETFEYFSIKSIFSYIRIFFDWEIKKYFYKQEPIYLVKEIFFYISAVLKKVFFQRKRELDALAYKEIMEFRSFHLKGNRSGLNELNSNQFEYEFDRIKTREKEE